MKNADQGTPKAQKEEFLNKVWTDDAYRAQIQKNPKAALAEFGAQIADDVEIKFVMDTDRVKYLHIPAAPVEGEISETDLMNAVGGTTPICFASATMITAASIISISANV